MTTDATYPPEDAALNTEPPPIGVPSLIRTLIVDDSAFVRKVVREMLSRSPFIEVVGTARDGHEALKLIEELKPNVVTCDLVMPGMNGVELVRAQMARKPVPILILSASAQDAELGLQALQAGAVDFVRKPTALATEELLTIRTELVDKVKGAARAPLDVIAASPGSALKKVKVHARSARSKVDFIVIGVSTGGPQALRKVLPQLPADFPVPVAIVLHMPVGYTGPFAQKLDEISQVEVREAQDGDVFRPGLVLLAAAGRHLVVRRNASGSLVAQLSLQPIEKLHRPSVDVLFQSAAETLHDRVLGVVLTGMGDDGKQGAAWIKAQGGQIFTEAKSTCVIHGMPRSVEEAGLSDASVPLDQVAQTLIDSL